MNAQSQPNHRRTRAGGTLILAIALALASPAAALADPGTIDPSVTVTDPTGTTGTGTTKVTLTVTSSSPTTVTATTTGTSATATAPSSATTGSIGSATAPSTGGLSTGSGPITTSQTVTPSGPGATSDESASTVITDPASPALVFGRGIAAVDQGLNADLAGHDPATRTRITAGAQAHAVLCLLAQISVEPSRATLSSLCNGGPSTARGAGRLEAANEITGTSLSAAPNLRAAACLLALVSSSAPRTIDARDLAGAALSTLCGGATASTADAAGDVHLTEDRTGTDVSVGPIAAVAACLLANANAGTTTVAHLATLCGTAASPSTLSGDAPFRANDATSGTTVGVSPAANAALCLLVGALATVASDPTDSSAVASLSTACGPATAPTTSPIIGSAPATVATAGGTGADLSPSVDAALCTLAQAGVSATSSTAQLSSACGPGAPGTTTAATNDGTPAPTVSVGPGAPPQGGTVIVPVPQGGTGAAPVTPGHGVLGVNFPPRSGVLGLTSLPSTSTEMLGGLGLLLIALGTSLAVTQRRRR